MRATQHKPPVALISRVTADVITAHLQTLMLAAGDNSANAGICMCMSGLGCSYDVNVFYMLQILPC